MIMMLMSWPRLPALQSDDSNHRDYYCDSVRRILSARTRETCVAQRVWLSLLFISQTAIKPAIYVLHFFSTKNTSQFTNNCDLWQFTWNSWRKKRKKNCTHKNTACEVSITPPPYPPPPTSADGHRRRTRRKGHRNSNCVHHHHIVYYSGLGNRSNWMHLLTSFRRPSACSVVRTIDKSFVRKLIDVRSVVFVFGAPHTFSIAFIFWTRLLVSNSSIYLFMGFVCACVWLCVCVLPCIEFIKA